MYRTSLITLSLLFFMVGFITCLNDILVPFLKDLFRLNYTEAALIQFSFFGAYGLTSIPASTVVAKFGYKKSIVIGFFITAFGCILFYPAVTLHRYALFLLALFVLAVGIVFLQVAANPCVSTLGSADSSSSRLSLVQAFNSLGMFLAPIFGALFILSTMKNGDHLKFAYLFLALVLIGLAHLLLRLDFPEAKSSASEPVFKLCRREPKIIAGILGIFVYVGAEVSIGSFLINYILEMRPMPRVEAASLVAIYWGGAMAGRFLGIFTLKEFPVGKVLTVHALLALSLVLISINSKGVIAVYSMILVGFCNSIMFPSIFSLTLKGLRLPPQRVSGLLITAILGGALIPLLTGKIADTWGLRLALLLPVLCYGYIAILGAASTEPKDLPSY